MDDATVRVDGGEIRRRRKRLKLSRAELAALTQLAAITIAVIERGRGDVRASSLASIARVLGCKMEDLMRAQP